MRKFNNQIAKDVDKWEKNFKKLKLLRYFNYITPLIQKVDNIDY